jgi:hypothetical protein
LLEIRKVSRDNSHIEMSKNRLFRLPVEQESESRLEATLGRMLASCQSITGRLRQRYMMARLTLSFADGIIRIVIDRQLLCSRQIAALSADR